MTDEITREMFQHSTVVIAGLNDHIEALTAENERLRAALENVTKATELAMYSLGGFDGRFGLRKATSAARAALAGDSHDRK